MPVVLQEDMQGEGSQIAHKPDRQVESPGEEGNLLDVWRAGQPTTLQDRPVVWKPVQLFVQPRKDRLLGDQEKASGPTPAEYDSERNIVKNRAWLVRVVSKSPPFPQEGCKWS